MDALDTTEPTCPNHVLLIGFMGSGKSTAARRIARMFGKVSFDTDIGIARMLDKTIPQIFAEEGEAGFRKHEHAYLEYLMGMPPAIVSCGGGIISTQENREMLRRLGFVVFMEVDSDEAVSRISSPDSRPLLSDRESMRELLQKRMPLYLETCDMRFDTTGKYPAQVARELGGILQQRGLI